MKNSSFRFVLALGLLALLVAAIWIFRAPRPAAASSPIPATSSAPTSAPAPRPAVAPQPPAPASPVAQAEIAATAAMYAAHAPLRVPEVADPDSTTNKQILGTMVAKALAQSAPPPPTSKIRP